MKNNSISNHRVQRMTVWFMPVVLSTALLVVVVVALVMCIRWHQQRSTASEEEGGYEEIYKKKSTKTSQSNKDNDDYETVSVKSKKITKNANKTNDGVYRPLISVKPQHEREYASLNKATCSSKTSLSSITSGCDVKEDGSKNRTKRRGIVIPSLSDTRGEAADEANCLSQAQGVMVTKSTKKKSDVKLTSQQDSEKAMKIVNQEQCSRESRTASVRPKPVPVPKPAWKNQKEKKKPVRKIQYENATVVIDGDKTETRRVELDKAQ